MLSWILKKHACILLLLRVRNLKWIFIYFYSHVQTQTDVEWLSKISDISHYLCYNFSFKNYFLHILGLGWKQIYPKGKSKLKSIQYNNESITKKCNAMSELSQEEVSEKYKIVESCIIVTQDSPNFFFINLLVVIVCRDFNCFLPSSNVLLLLIF